MNAELTKVLAGLRKGLEAIYGDRLVRLMLFGSQARGDAEDGSDIDVLVVLKGAVRPGEEIERTGDFIAALCLEHGVVITCVYMDEDHFLNRQGPLLRNIRREGMAI